MCPHESPGRLLESARDCRSRWMVISLEIVRQNPAYRAALHQIFHPHLSDDCVGWYQRITDKHHRCMSMGDQSG